MTDTEYQRMRSVPAWAFLQETERRLHVYWKKFLRGHPAAHRLRLVSVGVELHEGMARGRIAYEANAHEPERIIEVHLALLFTREYADADIEPKALVNDKGARSGAN